MERLLDINEVSEILGVAKSTIYSWTFQNRIPHIKLSKRLLKFRENDILTWIQERSVHTGTAFTEKQRPNKKSLSHRFQDDYIEKIVETSKRSVIK